MNKPLINIILVALFFAFAACGGGGDAAQETSSADESASAGSASDVRTINIIGVDDMKFVVEAETEEKKETEA